MVKNPPDNVGDSGLIPGLGRSLKKEMAAHASILTWETPWTEEPDELQSMGLQSQTRLSDYTKTVAIFGLASKKGGGTIPLGSGMSTCCLVEKPPEYLSIVGKCQPLEGQEAISVSQVQRSVQRHNLQEGLSKCPQPASGSQVFSTSGLAFASQALILPHACCSAAPALYCRTWGPLCKLLKSPSCSYTSFNFS